MDKPTPPEEALGRPRPAPAAASTPWRAGIATGIGSLPGTDPAEAARLIAGELPDLPHLAELPQRGPGADLVGRTAALLVDLPVEVLPSGWRLARRPGLDLQRAKDFLAWDLDAAEQHFAGAPWLKVQLAGPWTLAARIETPRGHRAVADEGAAVDLAASLTEGLAAHLADLTRRLPGTDFVIQIDEPSLPAVLAGTLATASGFGTVPAVPDATVEQRLSGLLDTLDGRRTVVHCCHPDAPLGLLRAAGADAVSWDMTRLGHTAAELDPLGEIIEAGTVLLAGLVPAVDQPETPADPAARRGRIASPDTTARPRIAARPDIDPNAAGYAEPLLTAWHQLGLEPARFGQVVVTPGCGLGHASPAWARRALRLVRQVAVTAEQLVTQS